MTEQQKANAIFVQVVDRPARKLILKRGIKAEDYLRLLRRGGLRNLGCSYRNQTGAL